MIEQWITPALVVAVGVALWREMHRGFDRLASRMDRMDARIDRHLEGHP